MCSSSTPTTNPKRVSQLVGCLILALLICSPTCVVAALAANPTTPKVEKLDVAIIGGGPTGLSTALALMRGAGPDAAANKMAVFESDSFAPKGASIVISKPGWAALKCIDPQVWRKAKRDGAPVSALFFKDFSGRHRLPRPIRWFVWSLYPLLRSLNFGIVKANGWHSFRSTLLEGAMDVSRDLGYAANGDYDAKELKLVRSNMQLSDVNTSMEDDRVLLTFQDGTRVSAAIVLACDGTFSTIRKCLEEKSSSLPSKPFLIDEHRTVWRGTAPNIDAKNIATFYVASPRGSGEGESATACIFPAGKTTPGASISIVMPTVPGRASDSEEARVRLKSALAKFGTIDGDILKTIDGVEHMLEHKLHVRDFDAHPSLASGHERIAFLGDSAHPLRPTGEGVAIALEDAWTLGKLAKDAAEKRKETNSSSSSDIFTPELLSQYVKGREKRVTAVCESIREFAESFYDDNEGADAIKHDNFQDGKLNTEKTSIKMAMKKVPIHLEPLAD